MPYNGYKRPQQCIHPSPNARTVIFAGVFIHLATLHLRTGISQSHLSLIFNHKRKCSIDAARNIAFALGMSIDAFLNELAMGLPPASNKGVGHSALSRFNRSLHVNRKKLAERKRQEERLLKQIAFA